MNIEEKKIVIRSVRFTEDDLHLIRSVMQDVWKKCTVSKIIERANAGFIDHLSALLKIQDCAFYGSSVSEDDRKFFDTMSDICCSFVLGNENDERVPAVNEIWEQIVTIQRGNHGRK